MWSHCNYIRDDRMGILVPSLRKRLASGTPKRMSGVDRSPLARPARFQPRRRRRLRLLGRFRRKWTPTLRRDYRRADIARSFVSGTA
jgi:hypothetical protein